MTPGTEVTISVRAEGSEVTVDVSLPITDGRIEGVGELVDRLVRSAGSHAVAGAHAAVTNVTNEGVGLAEVVALLDPRLHDLDRRLGGVSDWLHKVERDLDGRVDYALRQLAAIEAPRGEDLVAHERGQAIKEAVVHALYRLGRGEWATLGSLARRTGWAYARVDSALAELHIAGEVERRDGGLSLWRLPAEEVVEEVVETKSTQEVW